MCDVHYCCVGSHSANTTGGVRVLAVPAVVNYFVPAMSA